MRLVDALITFVAAACILDCRGDPAAEIALVVDANAGKKATFAPKSAFAEYVEVADQRNELRLTLSTAEISCDSPELPSDEDTVVTVLLLTPHGAPPKPAEYGYGLVPDLGAPLKDAVAIPKAWLGGKSWLFQPGGGVKLTEVKLEPNGTVAGLLDFSYPGDADHPATRVQGRFSAWLCRHAPVPKR